MNKLNFFNLPSIVRSGQFRRDIILNIENNIKYTKDYRNFGYDYFDNPDLGIGYGGYSYDGRYAASSAAMRDHYKLSKGSRVLEIGCAKGFMLLEFQKLGMKVDGIEISEYAARKAHPDVKDSIQIGDICNLPFEAETFDLVFGKDVLEHNSEITIRKGIMECMRVSKGPIFFEVCVGRTQLELDLMKRWDDTFKTVQTPEWWDRFFIEIGFSGDLNYKVVVPETG